MPNLFRIEKFTGYHMAAVMVAFFGTIITVNMFLAYSATSTWTGLVVKNSYVASQAFNARTEELRAQQELGWRAGAEYNSGTLIITMSGGETPATVTAKVGRPAFEAEDHVLAFTPVGQNRFAADTTLGGGVWQADITAIGTTGEKWERPVRFTVSGQ